MKTKQFSTKAVVKLAEKHAKDMLEIFRSQGFDEQIFDHYYFETVEQTLHKDLEKRMETLRANILDKGD